MCATHKPIGHLNTHNRMVGTSRMFFVFSELTIFCAKINNYWGICIFEIGKFVHFSVKKLEISKLRSP